MDKLLRTRLTTVVVLATVFGAGLLIGLAADRSLGASPAPAETATAAEGDEEGGTERRRVPMYEQVGPSADQKMVIDSIVQEYRAAMKGLHAEFSAAYATRYQALLEETRGAIKGVLTPEQAHAYDSLIAERDRRRAERDEREDQDE